MRRDVAEVDLQPRMDALAARVREETQIPGVVLGASVDGRRTYAAAGTYIAGERRRLGKSATFALGCASKLPLAIRTHELARRGALDLRNPIAAYLPELRDSACGKTVLCEHLLSHTSGYRGTSIFDGRTRALGWDGLVTHLKAAPQLFAPGRVFSYEHTESVVLWEILRRVGGAAPGNGHAAAREVESAGRHVFDERAGRFVVLDKADSVPAFWQPAFSERAVTVDDLLDLGQRALGVPELQRNVVNLPPSAGGPLCELMPLAFGLGCAELRGGFRGSTGVAAGQCVGLRFAPGIVVAVGLNAIVPHLRDFVLTALCNEVAGVAPREARQRFGFDLRDLGGRYIGPGTALVTVQHVDERLICTLGHEDRRASLQVDFVLDDDLKPVLRSPVPQLSLAFFREPMEDAMGLMLGLSAYRRVAC
jgi:beta-lactamase family protein